MPPKIRELISLLNKRGFKQIKGAGKGSHIKMKSSTNIIAILRGRLGDDSPKYLIKHVNNKIRQHKQRLNKQINKPKTPSQVLADKRAKSNNDKGFSR